MKKLISVLLSIMMILQVSVSVFADYEPSFAGSTVLRDANGENINWIADIEVVQVGAKTVLYATKRASETNTGVFAFDVTDINNPVLIDSKAMGTVWNQPRLDVFEFNGKNYLAASGSAESTKIWRINSDGTLEDGTGRSGTFLNATRDMTCEGNTLFYVGPQINANTPTTTDSGEVLQEDVGFCFLFGDTCPYTGVTLDYLSGGYASAIAAREINGEVYIVTSVTGKIKQGSLIEGVAASENSAENEYFLEIRKKRMLNRWNNDKAFTFDLISREKVDVEIGRIVFADDNTLVSSYYSGTWNSETVGLYKTEIDLDAENAADVIKVNPVVTETSGIVALPLDEDFFAFGSRKDLGYLDIYNEETGEKVYRYNYPDNRPTALAKFNGNIYSTTEDGQLYVNSYAESKQPAYDVFATYTKQNYGGPVSVALLDGENNRISPANASEGSMTGHIKVTEVNGKTYAYVVKRMEAIYVYDVTNYGEATWVQTVPLSDTTTSRNTELDILEVSDEKFLMVNETNLGGKYLHKIGADGKLSEEMTSIAWANHPESDFIAADNWILATGNIYNEIGIHLFRYNGKNADVVTKREIYIPIDGATFEIGAYKKNNVMYIAAMVYSDIAGTYKVNIYKVSLSDYTYELIVSEDMTAKNGNCINGFEFVDSDTVLISIFTNGPQVTGTIGLGIMEFDEKEKTANYTPLDTQRSTAALQVLDETGKIMFIEKFDTQTSVALADVYEEFVMWTENPYRWWNNNNTTTYRIEDGLVYKDVLYTMSMSGDMYLWKLNVGDVACEEILAEDATLAGNIIGYQSGDAVSIYLAGKDYTATVASDGSFKTEQIDIAAGEVQNGAVSLIRGGSIAAMRDITVSYAGADGAVLNIASVQDSEGNDATGFTEGEMSLKAQVATDSKTSKTAILAVYEGGQLKNVYSEVVADGNGEVTFEFLVEDAVNTSAKLMLWESMKTLNPLVGAVDVEFDVNF